MAVMMIMRWAGVTPEQYEKALEVVRWELAGDERRIPGHQLPLRRQCNHAGRGPGNPASDAESRAR